MITASLEEPGKAMVLSVWFHGVGVMTTAQIHLIKPELRLCTYSNLLMTCQRSTMLRISDSDPG